MPFHFSIGGYHSGHFEVVLRGDELHFFVSDYPMPVDEERPDYVVSVVGDADWEGLVQYLATIKWKRHYQSFVLDGIQWELSFSRGERTKRYSGSNAFPPDFDTFTALLRKITSRHQIPDRLIGGLDDE